METSEVTKEDIEEKTAIVKNAVEEVFKELPEDFNVSKLIKKTRRLLRAWKAKTKRPNDATITRRLRQLRDDKKLNYIVTHALNGEYKKLPLAA